MKTIFTGQAWFDKLLPEGFPLKTATLISGPGGTGKPLIGDTIVAAWLRQGGSVVFMSLQYPSTDFITTSLKMVAGLDLADYADRTAFIELDATMAGMEKGPGNHIRANVVKPDIWVRALDEAAGMVPDEGPGVLIFGSALNLLLFSPTYGRAILEQMKRTMIEDHRRTHLFSASTTAKKEEIAEIEAVADNLMMARSQKEPFRLFLSILRMKGVPFSTDEVEVPIPPQHLHEIKAVADHSRKRVIPQVSQL